MSQEAAPVGPSTEDPVLSPLNSLGLFQEDMEETSSMSGLAPDLSGESSGDPVCAGSGKRVLRDLLICFSENKHVGPLPFSELRAWSQCETGKGKTKQNQSSES